MTIANIHSQTPRNLIVMQLIIFKWVNKWRSRRTRNKTYLKVTALPVVFRLVAVFDQFNLEMSKSAAFNERIEYMARSEVVGMNSIGSLRWAKLNLLIIFFPFPLYSIKLFHYFMIRFMIHEPTLRLRILNSMSIRYDENYASSSEMFYLDEVCCTDSVYFEKNYFYAIFRWLPLASCAFDQFRNEWLIPKCSYRNINFAIARNMCWYCHASVIQCFSIYWAVNVRTTQ